LLVLAAASAEGAPEIRVVSDFGAQPADVLAVARSASGVIWRHCGEARLAGPGIDLFHRKEGPIALHERTPEGRARVGVSSRGNLWSQLTFQFAHEFGHVLARHTRAPGELSGNGHHANLWLEESLCETASLFALRAMAREWDSAPPYPNWKGYAPSLAAYAAQRLEESARDLPPDAHLRPWLRRHEAEMRANAVNRPLNNVIAARLLPLFEAEPAGWEAMVYLNRGRRPEPDVSLADHLAGWRQACPERLRSFVTRVATALETPIR
jgi:hypothetical protein